MSQPEILSSGSWRKVALWSGLLYGILMGLVFSYQTGRWWIGMPLGGLAGLLFGPLSAWLMRTLVRRQSARFRVEPPDFGSETILMEGPANHFKGIEGVGGYLWVTDRRVHFASHRFNIRNHTWTALLSDILEVAPVKTLGLIGNGLRVVTAAGAERFVVHHSRAWADLMSRHLPPHAEPRRPG